MTADDGVKDASIITVVEKLRCRFGQDAFVVRDHWEADIWAIGLAARDDSGRLVYVCTFGKSVGQYDVALELPPGRGEDFPYTPAGDRSDVDFEGLAALFREHLRLP